MPGSSPATRLHDLVVVNDQSGVEWRVATASIDGGRIVISTAVASVPKNFLVQRATYTICALDGGNRVRRFASLTLDATASIPHERYVFG